jgi:hypothetical protein
MDAYAGTGATGVPSAPGDGRTMGPVPFADHLDRARDAYKD